MNDLNKVQKLLKVLQNPYDIISTTSIYQSVPFSIRKLYHLLWYLIKKLLT